VASIKNCAMVNCDTVRLFLIQFLWPELAIRAFRGDKFTYGMVSTVFCGLFGVLGLAVVAAIFRFNFGRIDSVASINALVLALLIVLFLLGIAPAMFSSKTAPSNLPQQGGRRKLENVEPGRGD